MDILRNQGETTGGASRPTGYRKEGQEEIAITGGVCRYPGEYIGMSSTRKHPPVEQGVTTPTEGVPNVPGSWTKEAAIPVTILTEGDHQGPHREEDHQGPRGDERVSERVIP